MQIPLPANVAVTDNHVRVILPVDYGAPGKRFPCYHDWPYFREELVWLLPQLMSVVR